MIPLDHSPRASGKTTRALAWLAEDPSHRVVVVADQARTSLLLARARDEHPDAGITDRQIMAIGSFHRIRGRKVSVWVDQADDVLAGLFWGLPVAGASWTAPGAD